MSLKIMGIPPKLYKGIYGFYLSQTPLGYDQLLNANQPKKKFHMCMCDYLNPKIYLKVSPIHISSLVSPLASF
jgi:hypothetical protein